MSKSKKRHSNSSAVVRAKARDSVLADKQVRDRARMDPVARNLLFINLIFLAAGQMLYTHGMLHYSAHRRPGPPVRRQEAGRQAAAQVKICEKPENHPAEGPEAGLPP